MKKLKIMEIKNLIFLIETILDSIKIKNKNLSKDFKVNIIKEHSHNKIQKNLSIKNISINSKSIQKNDIFFAIKGKKRW